MITVKNYTNEELNYIKDNYLNMTINDLANKLNKTKNSISNAIRKLGLIKQVHNKWSDNDNKFLIENYCKLSADEIAKHLNRTRSSVFTQADRLNLKKQNDWLESDIVFLKNNYELMSHAEIANKLNRTRQAITLKCFELNLYKKELPWEKWEIDFVKENYMEMPTKDISKILNRTSSAIQIKARKMGLKKYPYCCNYNYFEEIDTEEKAYWLGFLTADGWINKNEKTNAGVTGIELQYADIEHLKKFNKSISGNYQITDRWKTCNLSKNKNAKNHICVIRIFSLTMYNSLIKYGFSNNKSYDFFIPEIKNELIRHYVRGYFDGDGCLCVTNKSFSVGFVTASELLCKDLKKILCKIDIDTSNTTYVNEYGTIMYRPEICKKKDKLKFLQWIYEDSSIYLDRKYKKYLKVKEQNEQSSALL